MRKSLLSQEPVLERDSIVPCLAETRHLKPWVLNNPMGSNAVTSYVPAFSSWASLLFSIAVSTRHLRSCASFYQRLPRWQCGKRLGLRLVTECTPPGSLATQTARHYSNSQRSWTQVDVRSGRPTIGGPLLDVNGECSGREAGAIIRRAGEVTLAARPR